MPKTTFGAAVPGNRGTVGLNAFVGTFAASMLLQGCTIVQGIILARLLGPSGRGELATVILWPSVFAAIGIFGTNIALARAAATTDRLDSVIRTSIFLAFLSSSISSIACYVCLPYLLPDTGKHLLGLSRLFVLFIPLNHLALNVIAADQGSGNFRRFNFTRVLLNPFYCVFLICLWIYGITSVQWVVTGLLLAHLLPVVARLLLVLKDIPLLGRLYSPILTIRESVRFGLAGAVVPLYLQVDKALILWLLHSDDLGFYTVALSAGSAIGIITNSMGMVAFTIAAQENPGEGFDRIAMSFRISLLLWVLFGCLLAGLMGIVLPFVYGTEFLPAVIPARLLIIGSAIAGLANLLEQSLRGQGKAFIGLEGRVAGLLVMIVSGMLLMNLLGLSGVCLAYILCQLTCLSVIIWRTNQYYAVNSLSCYFPRYADIRGIIDMLRQANHRSVQM